MANSFLSITGLQDLLLAEEPHGRRMGREILYMSFYWKPPVAWSIFSLSCLLVCKGHGVGRDLCIFPLFLTEISLSEKLCHCSLWSHENVPLFGLATREYSGYYIPWFQGKMICTSKEFLEVFLECLKM